MRNLVYGAAAAAMMATGGGAIAADLPAAPEPVDYVRVCDAFGSGFLYIPGTDTCTKIAGRVRADYRAYGSNEAFGGPGWYTSTQPGYVFRARAYLYADTRTNTEFGLLRTYTELWITNDTNADSNVTLRNAQIEFAGGTFGRTGSFYDLYFGNTFNSVFKLNGTGNPDFFTTLAAYTFDFGSGLTASLSVEDAIFRQKNIWAGGASVAPGAPKHPDAVGNFKIQQDWGSAQVMGALHEVRAASGTSAKDATGWALGAGLIVNLPMIAKGDRIGFQGGFANGALNYVGPGAVGPSPVDAVLRRGKLDLVDSWSIGGGYLHNWTPQLSSAVDASWLSVDVPGRKRSFDNLDVQANLAYKPVAGLTTALEVEWKRVYVERGDTPDGLVGFLRVQRDF